MIMSQPFSSAERRVKRTFHTDESNIWRKNHVYYPRMREKEFLCQFNKLDIYTDLNTGELSSEKLQIIYEKSQSSSLSKHERKELEEEWMVFADTKETLRIESIGGYGRRVK